MTPGWTTATRFSWSISRIRSIAVNAIVSAAVDAGGATRQAGPGAARHDRHADSAAEPDDLGHLGRLGREGHGARAAPPWR